VVEYDDETRVGWVSMTDLYAAFRLPEPPRISFPPGDTVKKEKKEKILSSSYFLPSSPQ
jgi:hypothetical protein